ncbi:oxidoreductase [Mycolicibacterium insubricum]|jgi:3alpha(or 20beta)-hydroxysteroid dehydrogenase|uniref:Oxidoreductase n=1 Tax=Mycolicibacterium insubricum TaxID=444597 RepID=A0A1X0D866_9MYCO|nr:SDR family oxidoreductase [Mycolicibacterium insubricum]MCB9439528.1 SDR family oxidoreductase [Mycolicibacterium sp.]MCV7082801.1 SDR family oxidoreductase [Mycolicibacterium insubricum]ORA68583.1 oxidoreductase [Mycolicibacterium insubricum]BBZ65247.1 oxidoreductase [Mycolicibacterium insubricum]
MIEHGIVLVTGAARGQGAEIVKRLVAAGYRVAAADVLTAELAETVQPLGDAVIPVALDVSSAEHWQAAVADTRAAFGTLTALVNNAGVLHRAPVSEETEEAFERSWRINCLGPFLGVQAALPELRRNPGASIVNTCSTGAIRPFPNHAAYGAAKWGLRGLTQILAAELAPEVRVNAVLPGPVATDMLDAATQSRLAQRVPAGRLGTPADIADAVVFLLSEHASFITGAELVVDGGQSLTIG